MHHAEPVARPASRHSIPTLATPDPSATYEPEPSLELAEEQSAKLTWCVDFGAELRAMSTLDLWIGLHRGEIPRSTRVWRLGREAWTPAFEVAELSCALRPIGDDYPIIAVHEEEDDEECERVVTLAYGELPPDAVEPAAGPADGWVDPSELSDLERQARQVAPLLASAPPTEASRPVAVSEPTPSSRRAPEAAASLEETPRRGGSLAPVASISPPAPKVSTPPVALSIAPVAPASSGVIRRLRPARRGIAAALAAAAVWLVVAVPLGARFGEAPLLRAVPASSSVLATARAAIEPVAEEHRATERAVERVRARLAEDRLDASAVVSRSSADGVEPPTAAGDRTRLAAAPSAASPRASGAHDPASRRGADTRAIGARADASRGTGARAAHRGKSYSPTHRGQRRTR